MNDYLLFLSITFIATLSPGPAVFLAIKNGARYGIKFAIIGILGNVAAMTIMATFSSFGIGIITFISRDTLFPLLKFLGSSYLIYLGIRLCFSHFIIDDQKVIFATRDTKKYFSIFSEAFFVGISNPKAIVFFTALFPQFINAKQHFFLQVSMLTFTFSISSFLMLSLYALLATNIRRYLESSIFMRWFNRITGGIFIGFGVALANSKY